jgi:hypothetical protein
MIGWDDLPLEIVDKILRRLADILVSDYPSGIEWRTSQDTSSPTRHVPEQFLQFGKVILTCRHFHEILSNSSFQRSCRDRLLNAAAVKLNQMVFVEFNALHVSKYVEDEIISAVGLFWRNPEILDDFGVIRSLLLSGLPAESRLSLIPKLRPWIQRHVKENAAYPKRRVILAFRNLFNEHEPLELQAGPLCIPQTEHLEIWSIEKIASSRRGTPEKKRADLPESQLCRDIMQAKPNSFWCLRFGVLGHGLCSWACINFDSPGQYYVENDLFCRSNGGGRYYVDRRTWEANVRS